MGRGGHSRWAGAARPWLTAVPPWHHFKSVLYHVRAAEALGFHAAILLTGHYGPNWHDLRALVELVQPHVGCRMYGLPDFEANQPGFDTEKPGDTKDHAGRVETSLLWAAEPGCVDMSRLPDPLPPVGERYAAGANAAEADRRVGERMIADEARWLAAKAAELRAAYTGGGHAPQLTTFAQVEQLWADVILPALPGFKSMAPASDRGGIDPASRWAANAAIPDLPGVT